MQVIDKIKEFVGLDQLCQYLCAPHGHRLGLYEDGSVAVGDSVGQEIDEDERPVAIARCKKRLCRGQRRLDGRQQGKRNVPGQAHRAGAVRGRHKEGKAVGGTAMEFVPNKPPQTLAGLYRLVHRVIKLNAPNNIQQQDRAEMRRELFLMFSPLHGFVTAQEISRIAARFVYRRCKSLGWRKVRHGERVIWTHPEKRLV